MSLVRLLTFPLDWLRGKHKTNFHLDSNHKSSVKTTGILSMLRPKFDELPLNQGDPKASSWGLWGVDDELGTLNLITEDVMRTAAAEVKFGKAVSLKYDQ